MLVMARWMTVGIAIALTTMALAAQQLPADALRMSIAEALRQLFKDIHYLG